jgi:hypothetical protein
MVLRRRQAVRRKSLAGVFLTSVDGVSLSVGMDRLRWKE